MRKKHLCVLVCGDFDDRTNQRLLAWTKRAIEDLSSKVRFIFKPHPAFAINASRLLESGVDISDLPLSELLQECDIVFTSSTTSAAVDAYCYGLPVVQMVDGRTFDTSPLRGLIGVEKVYSSECLAEKILNVSAKQLKPTQLFSFDQECRGWNQLIDEFSRDESRGS